MQKVPFHDLRHHACWIYLLSHKKMPPRIREGRRTAWKKITRKKGIQKRGRARKWSERRVICVWCNTASFCSVSAEIRKYQRSVKCTQVALRGAKNLKRFDDYLLVRIFTLSAGSHLIYLFGFWKDKAATFSWLTLVCQEHLGERRHSDQEVQHSAAVGVVWAVVVRLHWRHGVILTNTLFVLLL